MDLHSLLDLELPSLGAAERRLADLSCQRRRRLGGFVLLCALAVAMASLLPQFGIALAAGAGTSLAATGLAAARRRTLLAKLRQDRAAYGIEPVSRAGVRFASRARRRRLARWLRKIVRAAEGSEFHPSYTAAALEERVLARRERLLGLAAALEDHEHGVHPAGVAIVHCLLTRPGVSPLYNPLLEERILDDALHRIEACVDREVTRSPR